MRSKQGSPLDRYNFACSAEGQINMFREDCTYLDRVAYKLVESTPTACNWCCVCTVEAVQKCFKLYLNPNSENETLKRFSQKHKIILQWNS